VLAALQLFLLMDVVFNWRWELHDFWMQRAIALGVYGDRRMPQSVTIGVISLVSALAFVWIWRRFRGRTGAALALTGTLLSSAVWCFEWISFHWVDRVFYRMVGGVMLVSLVWICLAIVTCLGAWLEGCSSIPRPQQ
jgi:hypothetical protein